jgi:ParB-like nuclease domain
VHFDRPSSFVDDDTDAERPFEDATDPPENGSRPAAPEPRAREGLPAGFRVRHDAHYVDALAACPVEPAIRQIAIADLILDETREPGGDELAFSIREYGLLQPLLVAARGARFDVVDGRRRVWAASAAGLDRLPCIVLELDEANVERVRSAVNARTVRPAAPVAPGGHGASGAQWALVSRLEALLSQSGAATARGFRSDGVVNAFRTDLDRALRMARASAVLAGGVHLQRRATTAGSVAQRILVGSRELCRAAGVRLQTVIETPAFRLPLDLPLIAQGVEGCVDAMLALYESAPASNVWPDGLMPVLTLKIRVVTPRPALFLELSQDEVPLPLDLARFFEPDYIERPGGAESAVLVAAAARVMRLHGGRVEIRRDGDVGSTLTCVLPQAFPWQAETRGD